MPPLFVDYIESFLPDAATRRKRVGAIKRGDSASRTDNPCADL
ncbi:hypothetical protein SAMN05444714_0949 [Yoonia litorea]|uniref:Uncharacterized protein n=1 Tax=Yoonia litorea TaxID=1123755 RepID=A0A1I6LW17_9RHOB|nr:hypothetical protein SAMN05444714_0949 [Yoonia litorea]